MGKRLVRDRALENWVVPGAEHQVRPVRDRTEHVDLLRRKVLEEATEVAFSVDTHELTKEMADVLAVLRGLAAAMGIPWQYVVEAEEQRSAAAGGFVRGMVWETSR